MPKVYALYDKNRYLLIGLGGLFVAEVVALCCLLANVTPRLRYNDECYVTSSPPNFQYYWSVRTPRAFDMILLNLYMY